MRLIILGGTGNISREITKQAVSHGHEVTIFNRGTRTDVEIPHGVRVVTGDRRNEGELKAKLGEIHADAVIDMISFNASDARTTMEVFGGRVEHIIFTSSVAAYNQPARHIPIKEEFETLRTENSFPYGFEKANMERELQEYLGLSTHITIIRPSLTFGIGCSNIGVLRQNANIVRRIKADEPLLMFGDGTNPWTFTFAPDLAKAYVMSLFRPATYDKAFHVTSGFTNIWEDLYTTVGEIVGNQPKIVHVPAEVLNKIDSATFGHINMEKKYCGIFDCSSFKEAVPEWEPEYDLKKGMTMIYQWWESMGFPFDEAKEELENRLCKSFMSFSKSMKLDMDITAEKH